MMSLFKIAALGAAGVFAWRAWQFAKSQADAAPAAFAPGQAGAAEPAAVRDAGPEAMRDAPGRQWSKIDQRSDESFPASDPPATY